MAKKAVVRAVSKPVQKAVVKTVAKQANKVKVVSKVVAKPIAKALPPVPVKQKPMIEAKPAKSSAPTKAKYTVGCYVVYPTHGVGKITAIETQKIGEIELQVFVIAFDKDKMILRVPVTRAEAAGLRPVSGGDDIEKAIGTLKGRARISRGMWSRRAQEYEAKINSGEIILIAEVVRDLHKNVDQAERSYSERMIYEAAFGRLARELAAAETIEHKLAEEKLLNVLKAQKKKIAA